MEGKNFLYYRLYSLYGELLTQKQREAVEDYFGLDLSLGEIAEMRGVSRQAIKYTLDCTEQTLLEYEKKMRLLNKITKIQELEIAEAKPLKEEILKILEDR